MQKSFLFSIVILLGICGAFVLLQGKIALTVKDKSSVEKAEKADQESSPFSAELITVDKERAQPGITLYSVVGKAKVLLLSLQGEIIHHWDIDAQRARLLPNGNLLVVHGSKWGTRVEPWKRLKFSVIEYDREGKPVWEYTSPHRIHHDVRRLENGNTIFPVRRNLEPQYMSTITHPKRTRLESVRTDSIIEVDKAGKSVWEWKAEDHLDLNSCGSAGCDNENPADWTHINTISPLPRNRWFESGDKRFRPGNILTVLRNWWELKVIDKDSKDTVWSFNGDYRGGLSGGHDAYMIEEGLPGEGNILVFDNGRSTHKGESIILEINPSTNEVVWTYEDGERFFSNSAGSVQRLANGNTLISQDLEGRVFEVTPEKEIVWEYKGNYRIARSRRYPESYFQQISPK